MYIYVQNTFTSLAYVLYFYVTSTDILYHRASWLLVSIALTLRVSEAQWSQPSVEAASNFTTAKCHHIAKPSSSVMFDALNTVNLTVDFCKVPHIPSPRPVKFSQRPCIPSAHTSPSTVIQHFALCIHVYSLLHFSC